MLRSLKPSDELYAAINAFIPGGYVPTGKEKSVALAGGGGAPAAGVASRSDKKAEKLAAKAAKVEKAAAKMSKEEKAAKSAPKDGAKKAKAKGAPVAAAPYVEKTPPGQKKDQSDPIAAAYDPVAVESAWYAWWEARGFFTPDPKKAMGSKESQKFVICLPPPNVTGSLHLGHTLTGAIQDSLIRWHRMCGHETLYIPGTDHAGIATQSTVEKRLLKNEGKTRHDLGREKFLERVWEWKKQYGSRICQQLRLIASSLDWTRECFTMDETRAVAVVEGFNQFHEQGLIYRGTKLVNWCPHLRTALSDLEVDHHDIEGITWMNLPGNAKVEVGCLTEFKYKVKGSKDMITVATTRLETMLGDVAIAVHPEDERYKHLVGKEVEHPFIKTRKMVVIADEMVDKDFGTGCVKITPAHDHNDYKVGKKFKLQFITCFNEDGTMNGHAGEFKGIHRFEARVKVEERLKELGLFGQKKAHKMRLGICSRSGDVIEPMLKPQWWMNCDDLAAQAVKVVRNGELKLIPNDHEKTWFYWLENIQEWCISRQLWWGHRIPAWKVVDPPQKDEAGEPKEVWFVGRNEAEALAKAQKQFGKKVKIEQDEDVLDTWFSSGLFPFSPLQWPNTEHDDYKAFFPTSVLETGHDILFFWVARMVMMSLGLTKKLPFHTVYLHAMVRDAHGRKMSKSLGNVIEPNEVIEGITLEALGKKLEEGNLPAKEVEKAKKGQAQDFPEGIPQCGADALRFGLLAYTLQGRNVNLDINRVVAYRQFCNKLWNIIKFALGNFEAGYEPQGVTLATKLAWEDRWILAKFNEAVKTTNEAMRTYTFANATTATYNFFLEHLSQGYLEIIKKRVQKKDDATAAEQASRAVALEVLFLCLDRGLRLLHPFLPFLTEELYQRLPKCSWTCETVMLAQYPTEVSAWEDAAVGLEMDTVLGTVKGIRSLGVSLGMVLGRDTPECVVACADQQAKTVRAHTDVVQTLAKTGAVKVQAHNGPIPAGMVASVVSESMTVYLSAAGLDLAKEIAKQEKKVAEKKKSAESYVTKMNAPNYAERVPAEIQQTNAEKLNGLRAEVKDLEAVIANLKRAMKK